MENIMEHKTSKKKRKPNMSYQAKKRRRGAITRLEEQLKKGRKPVKESTRKELKSLGINEKNAGGFWDDLNEKDITRIKKEIEVLKTRI